MKKALLIDMDGVLLDSTAIHSKAFVETLENFKVETDFNYLEFAGMSTFDAMSRIVLDANLDTTLIQDLTKFKRRRAELAFSRLKDIPLFPQVAENLARLSKVYRLALCTSASESTLKAFFRSNVDPKCFEHVITSNDIRKSKPDPEIYLYALSRMSLNPKECMVIEDSRAGVVAGLSANIEVIQIGNLELVEIQEEKRRTLKKFSTFATFSDWILRN